MVIEKPAGLLVHPPEDRKNRAEAATSVDVIRILRAQLKRWVYPVHRLDRATGGVMVLALNSETARDLQAQFKEGQVKKTYLALCRGYLQDQGIIDSPLVSENEAAKEQTAITAYETLFRFELSVSSSKHASSRFSLVQVRPQTGRWHQIRRHFKRISHPLLGDTVHGDGKQNRIWRELTGDSKLYLLAWSLGFFHPKTGAWHFYRARFNHSWHQVFDQAGVCPCERNENQ